MIIPIILLVLGVLVALVPHYVFPICAYSEKFIETKGGGLVPMACTYTARTETIIGLGLVLLAILLWLAKEKETRVFLSILVAAKGLAVGVIPQVVGYCKSQMMPCVSGTVPALRIAGGVIFVLGLISSFLNSKAKKAKEVA